MSRMPRGVDYASREEYYESLDKRTKEFKSYKEWKAKFDSQSKGLGDTIEKTTKALGVDKFVEGEDCGCDKRRDWLNKKFRYKVIECPTEEMFNWMQDFFLTPKSTLTQDEQKKVTDIINHTFKTKYKLNKCGSCYQDRIHKLKKLYESYL